MKTRPFLVTITLALAGACSSDPGADPDGAPADLTGTMDQGSALNTKTDLPAPDGGEDPGSAPDLLPGDVGAPGDALAWPPPAPYHNGMQCTLPSCDPAAPETTDLSGTWTQQITTKSQTCSPLARAMKPQLQPGHVETLTKQSILRAGECVYRDAVGGTVVGVIKGNAMITCEVLPVDTGVTPVVEGLVTFNGDTGSGSAWTYLFNVPLPPSSCQANCTIDLTRE
jgi:hypothetical protein